MGTQASSAFWIGNILQLWGGWEKKALGYQFVANNLSLVSFTFLFFFCGNKRFHFLRKKMSQLKGNKIKISVAETKKN
jgi:hypothetical protein